MLLVRLHLTRKTGHSRLPNEALLRFACAAARGFAATSLRRLDCSRQRPCRYMLNRQLQGELLSVHEIGQAYPGAPRVSEPVCSPKRLSTPDGGASRSNEKNITVEYQRVIEGMIAQPISMEELTATREHLISSIVGQAPKAHRRFLISFERGKADWSLLGMPGVSELAAVRWRRRNLEILAVKERAKVVLQLERVLFPPEFRPTRGRGGG